MSVPTRKPLVHRRRWLVHIATVVLLVCAAYYAVHWSGYRDGTPMRDFVAPYTGARCLWAGCNPYEVEQIAREFARAGGAENEHPPWSWAPPVYPPSTLVALLPVSLLPYHAARELWRWVNVALLTWGLL